MEKHIQKKINSYCNEYKHNFINQLGIFLNGLKDKIDIENYDIICNEIHEIQVKCAFINFPEVKKNEFKKQKRICNVVPENEKCHAICSGGIRCSRRKQRGGQYCGTHIKGQPNGSINDAKTDFINENTIQLDSNNSKNIVFPRNENGIVKLYKDEEFLNPINVNEFMKQYMKNSNEY